MVSRRRLIDLGGQWECAPLSTERQEGRTLPWRPVAVPSSWHLAGLPNFAGTVQFRRHFPAPKGIARGERVWLRFHGVDYRAEVWLNGIRIGGHEGYFAPFAFEITALLRSQTELLVAVSAPLEAPGDWPDRKRLIKGIFQHHDCRPGAWDPIRGQEQGSGGIWNRVELEVVPETFIERLRVSARPDPANAARGLVSAAVIVDSLNETAARLRLTVAPLDQPETETLLSETTLTLPAGHSSHAIEALLAPAQLWWCWDQGEPFLYQLRAEIVTDDGSRDDQSAEFGVRELRIAADTTWWLNGRRVFPRGTNLIPTQWLSTYDDDAIANDVALLRQANVNAIRVHAHVNRDELYRACDRAGLLVWQDFALQWSYQEDASFTAEACRQIGEMAEHLYNHPSIVVWCCHNEPSSPPEAGHTLDPLLAEALRAVDSTRHIEKASDFRTHPYPGWYWSSPDEFRARPSGPFISEFGAQALPAREALDDMFAPGQPWPPDWNAWAYHDFQYDQTVNVAGLAPGDLSASASPALDDWITRSQRYQARLLRLAIESYRRGKYRPISGLFQFMFVDCWNAITWSVLDFERRPKLGYEALRLAYQPLLPSIDLRRENAIPGGEIQVGFWIVNDLPRAFENLDLRFGLRDPAGRVWWSDTQSVPRLEADSVLAVHAIEQHGFSRWRVPPDAPPGDYVVFSQLFDHEGTRLAANEAPFTVLPPPPR